MDGAQGFELILERGPRSASQARRWIAGRLQGAPPELVNAAELLASELVTNAVLHADPPVSISLERSGGAIRVAVSDGSPALPRRKGFGTVSETGRGLHLLEAVASEWGATPLGSGKTVWFCLQEDMTPGLDGRADLDGWGGAPGMSFPVEEEPVIPSDVPSAGLVPIQILRVPVSLYLQAEQHNEALVREFKLMAAEGGGGPSVPERLLQLSAEVSSLFGPIRGGVRRQVEDAQAEGRDRMDIHFSVPTQAVSALERLAHLLDEADDFCVQGRLLTLQSSQEIRMFRRWYREEVVNQAEGTAPGPWHY